MVASVGRGAKNKGAQAEREAAAMLMLWCGHKFDIQRNLEQTRNGGFDLVGVPGLAIEVKRQENLSLPAWWRQTVAQAAAVGGPYKGKAIPFLMYRQSRGPWKFKIRVQVCHYNWNGDEKAPVVDVTGGVSFNDVHMEIDEAKVWFKAYSAYTSV